MRIDMRFYLISSLMITLAMGLKVPWRESESEAQTSPQSAQAADSVSGQGDLGQVTHMHPSDMVHPGTT